MSQLVEATVTIILAVIGLAMVSVLFSRKANTQGVIQSGASGLGNLLAVAQSPVTGGGVNINLSYPGGGFGGYNPGNTY